MITPTHIVCANVGDSRCVLGLQPTEVRSTIALSDDHKPSNEEEKLRIEKAGGFVLFDRVNGELAMSRAFGDFQYKSDTNLTLAEQLVLPIPDIAVHVRSSLDEVCCYYYYYYHHHHHHQTLCRCLCWRVTACGMF